MTLLVLSPHLDDAVLSAGQFVAAHPDAVVATVFAGVPDAGENGGYDRRTGFASAAEAMARRRDEDAIALALLRARPAHLDFLDRQYRRPSPDEAIADRLRALIVAHRPATVLGPIGLIHPDHRQVGRVWPAVAREFPAMTVLAYEDLPYRVQFPLRAADVVRAFAAAHGAVEMAPDGGPLGVKAQAMLAYASQLATVQPLACLAPERLWRLFARRDRDPSPTP
ncbi:PIG-L deacetylase family protein [Micromonospora sp. CPCC 206061]|uniref:PIG-L deacetylase family protein n=1 Tax=Micromonospora sp. CPCC 206061 TaxID=3122410 RepID=UPI002FF01332